MQVGVGITSHNTGTMEVPGSWLPEGFPFIPKAGPQTSSPGQGGPSSGKAAPPSPVGVQQMGTSRPLQCAPSSSYITWRTSDSDAHLTGTSSKARGSSPNDRSITKPTQFLFHPKEMKPRLNPLTFQGKKLAWKGARIFTQSPFSELPGDPGFTGNRKPFSQVE